MDLHESRRLTAESIYEGYDLSYEVVDANGWTWEGDEANKAIFFADPDDSTAPTIKGVLTIRFEPDSPVPADAKCVVRGEEVGNLIGGTLADHVVEGENAPRP